LESVARSPIPTLESGGREAVNVEFALEIMRRKTRRYKPPMHMIKLTQEREITPYVRCILMMSGKAAN
jgi:hypothetical protein